MTDRAKKLLDNLLGLNRNIVNNEDYCIYYIAGGCPYEILKNTKISLGSCKYKIHGKIEHPSKVLYEKELFKLISNLLNQISNKPNKEIIINDKNIRKKEHNLEIKLDEIESNTTDENIIQMYEKFRLLENEIKDYENMKQAYFKNNTEGVEKCTTCNIPIIKNFYSEKYIRHLQGRVHNGILRLRKLHDDLKKKFF